MLGSLFLNMIMKTTGFTFVELIVVILLVGILSVSAIPRFFSDDDFKARGIVDEIISSVRHAQHLSMARGEQYKIDISPSRYEVRKTDNSPVRHPNGESTYLIDASKSLPPNLIQSTVSVEFNSLGRPVKADSSNITNDTDILIPPFTIRIEEETGYAHLL